MKHKTIDISSIKIKGLLHRFPEEQEIKYEDLVFEKGKPCMILGASGSGKSTLLNIISMLITPTEGEVEFFVSSVDGKVIRFGSHHNRDIFTASERDAFRISNVGYIYQDFKLIEDMSVKDNIDILRIEGVDTSNADTLLKALGIYEYRRKKIKYLSGGQKQRVAIARALVKNPSIILADEPTGNLNFEIGEKVVRDLVEYSNDKILIVVSHDTRLAQYFDHVIKL